MLPLAVALAGPDLWVLQQVDGVLVEVVEVGVVQRLLGLQQRAAVQRRISTGWPQRLERTVKERVLQALFPILTLKVTFMSSKNRLCLDNGEPLAMALHAVCALAKLGCTMHSARFISAGDL